MSPSTNPAPGPRRRAAGSRPTGLISGSAPIRAPANRHHQGTKPAHRPYFDVCTRTLAARSAPPPETAGSAATPQFPPGPGVAAPVLTTGPPRSTRGPQQQRPAGSRPRKRFVPQRYRCVGSRKAAFPPRYHPASGTARVRACDLREFRNSTVTWIKIPPTIAVLRFAATILQYKYLKSELGTTKKYGSR